MTFFVSLSHCNGWRKWLPCGDIFQIDNCVCGEDEGSEVNFPFQCKWSNQPINHCVCKDGSRWNPPPGPCEDGSHDVESCDVDEDARTITCTCDDGSTFDPMQKWKMGGCGKGGGQGCGRGNGRFRGRGGGSNGCVGVGCGNGRNGGMGGGSRGNSRGFGGNGSWSRRRGGGGNGNRRRGGLGGGRGNRPRGGWGTRLGGNSGSSNRNGGNARRGWGSGFMSS